MQRIRYRLVYNRRNMLNKQGKALIQVEASLNGRKVYISTRTYIVPFEWDKRTSTVINHPHAREINAWLFEFMMKIEWIELSLWKRGVIPTLLQIKDFVKGKSVKDLSFRSFCLSVIDKSNRKQGTKCNLRGTLTIMDEFKAGYEWEDMTYLFLKDFELWLLKRGAARNTIAKHLQNIRTLINEAISAGYISSDSDPFKSFSIKHEKVEHRFLNPEELKRMEDIKVSGKLSHIKDAFLFCCYTGLRFSDFKHLQSKFIKNIKGRLWLMIKTEKTGYDLKIPLYLLFEGKALDILNRYPSIESFTKIGCNADTNRHLAVLQKMAKIETRTTFHTARHTCATLLCHQGVPITTVQKILGHTKLTTTQLYSEVMADTIVKDLKSIKKKLKRKH